MNGAVMPIIQVSVATYQRPENPALSAAATTLRNSCAQTAPGVLRDVSVGPWLQSTMNLTCELGTMPRAASRFIVTTKRFEWRPSDQSLISVPPTAIVALITR